MSIIFKSHAASKEVSKFEMFPERHKINATENIPIHNTRY